MINSLECNVRFVSSGFTLDSKFQPLTGITAVVGENGVGKTFSTIELTRYLLYGKKALRGPASGYKNLTAKGDFTIRGEQYHIERGPQSESISDVAGKVLAVQAKAVTEKVTELMGYGLEVFDICNASVQGKSHLFSDMQPAQRKQMIDRVVGLSSNEAVEKACRAEATVLRREVDALSRTLVVPVAPTARFPGSLSVDIETSLAKGRQLRNEYNKLDKSLVTRPKPIEPSMPKPSLIDIDILQRHQDEERDLARERTRLTAEAAGAGAAQPLGSDLDAAEARLAKRKLIEAAGPQPTLGQAAIEHGWQEWALYDVHVSSDDVTCPKCSHMFKPTGSDPLTPEHSKVELRDQQQCLAKWNGLTNLLPNGPDLSAAEIKGGRQAIMAVKGARIAQETLSKLPAPNDRQQQLDRLRGLYAQWEAYGEDMVLFEKEQLANQFAVNQLSVIGTPPTEEELDTLASDLADAKLFESQWAEWDKQTIAFNALSAEIEDKRTLAEEFRKGGEALADARATIKAFLAPALSRTASSLLYDMTHGKLQTVTIDDEMNILVGSQTLETLSGGGLTVANIALRVALGQVLVADTFPVFLGDEIDADVDAIRREAVIEALVGLKDHLKQIILVTHRDLSVADHVHSLSDL